MRKKCNELYRIKTLIENDRYGESRNFNNVFLDDINKVICEYFEKLGETSLKIEKEKGRINCEITFSATNFKSFDFLSKD